MRKIMICLMILALAALSPFALFACTKSNVNSVMYDKDEYTEAIDLSRYKLVFEDDFDGELDRDVWGDTRQGTRRNGYWTKNLAFTDGDGHLVIRTEKGGSRYCSDTKTRSVTSYNDSVVTVTYDDCYLFDESQSHDSSSVLVGNVILQKYSDLGEQYAALMDLIGVPTLGEEYIPQIGEAELSAYRPFYDTAMELYTYYSFVKATKSVDTPLEKSALVDVAYDYTLTFGGVEAHKIDLRDALSRLYGFSSEGEFVTAAERIAQAYYDYAMGGQSAEDEALEEGCFRTENGRFIFPIAFRNESTILLTYVIVDAAMHVSVWVNDVSALLRAVNYNYDYYSGAKVDNESYCKNVLFVTGPEGVYSGALRTRDLYTHGYGYYEIRCKLPSVEGIWHAFWLMCGDVYAEENGSTDGIEIDVFEYLPARDAINCALHWDGYDDAHKNDHLRFEKVGCADDKYHTFGMNWDETGYTFYIDGKKVWHTTGGGICPEEGYMKISTEYGDWGDWVGDLDLGDLPVDWVIDYVKIYDKLS